MDRIPDFNKNILDDIFSIFFGADYPKDNTINAPE
jgi:hypothetical protein